MLRGVISVVLLAATNSFVPAPVLAAPSFVPSATTGVRLGDDAAGGFVDFVLPAVATEKGLGFVNPRFSLEDQGAEEVNIGAGWRQLAFDDRVLLGGNVYFDSRHSEHGNRFNQLGFGLEVLSRWFDVRANYYLPESDRELIASGVSETVESSVQTTSRSSEGYGNPYAEGNQIAQDYTRTTRTTTTTTTTTTRRLFEQFESAMEGFDAEIGALLPLAPSFPSVRLFGGYYSFEDAFGNRVEGPKGRAEVRIGSFLSLDGEVFDDDELNGTSYYAGARVALPFDLAALFAGKSPFVVTADRAQPALASRLTEMVVRDPRVQTGESELAENEGARTVEDAVEKTLATTSSARTYVLMGGVTFVDDDNAGGAQNGTAEKPYSDIQAAVDASGDNPVVYVHDGDYASVTLAPGVTLWGEGTPVPAYGGMQFGGGAYPRIGGASPAVTVAANTRVTGVHITNTGDHGIYGTIDSGGVVIDNNVIEVTAGSDAARVDGILLRVEDAEVTISGNQISSVGGSGTAVALESSGSTAATIDGNTILGDGPNNGGIAVEHSGGALTLTVTGNAIDAGDTGLSVANQGAGAVTANVRDNTVSAGASGMTFETSGGSPGAANATPSQGAGSRMTAIASGNSVVAGDAGLSFMNVGGTLEAWAADNALNAGAVGFEVMSVSGVTTAAFSGNTARLDATGESGVKVTGMGGSVTASLSRNTVNLDGVGQSGVETTAVDASMSLTASGNTVNVGTGTDSVGIEVTGMGGSVTASLTGNTVSLGGAGQVGIGATAVDASMSLTVNDNTVNVGAGSDAGGIEMTGMGGSVTASLTGNTVSLGGARQVGIETTAVDVSMSVTASGNTVNAGTGSDSGGIEITGVGGSITASLTGNTVNLEGDGQVGIETTAVEASVNVTASDNNVNAGTGTDTAGLVFSGVSTDMALMASGNSLTGAAATGIELLNVSGTFAVSAAAPGGSGDLSGLNSAMPVTYKPDSAAFTFLP